MNHPYQVLGTTVPRLLGRRRLVAQLDRHLLKPTPDHVQVVGLALYGKSVFLQDLADRHSGGSSHYATSAYTDLRHGAPLTDGDFRRRFAEVARVALARVDGELAEHLAVDDPALHELLVLVFDELQKRNVRLLMILDGFDHVLAGGGLTRTLWDQLRSLGQKPSLTLVTGSRRPLRELCKTEESRTSDFWEIFYDTPMVVAAFEEEDWNDLLRPLVDGGARIDGAAAKEIANWSGGVPVLTAALLEHLAEAAKDGTVYAKSDVDGLGTTMVEGRRELLKALWDECPLETRGDLAALAERATEGIPVPELSDARRRSLEGRGFAQVSGNRIRPSCRLMTHYAAQQSPAVADLKRLFAAADGYDENVRPLLELRLSHVSAAKGDKDLLQYVSNAVRDLEPEASLALNWVRQIAERALDIVWDAELGAKRILPDDWLQEWKQSGDKLTWLDASHRLPPRRGAQCRVLRLATGAEGIRPTARFATKPTALLIDYLQSVGDFGQHRSDYAESTVSKGFAASVVLTSIELVASVGTDLKR